MVIHKSALRPKTNTDEPLMQGSHNMTSGWLLNDLVRTRSFQRWANHQRWEHDWRTATFYLSHCTTFQSTRSLFDGFSCLMCHQPIGCSDSCIYSKFKASYSLCNVPAFSLVQAFVKGVLHYYAYITPHCLGRILCSYWCQYKLNMFVAVCFHLLLSLKILGFLDSRVCRSTGMSPSGSSFPKLSFNSLWTKKSPSVDRKRTQFFALYCNNLGSWP